MLGEVFIVFYACERIVFNRLIREERGGVHGRLVGLLGSDNPEGEVLQAKALTGIRD